MSKWHGGKGSGQRPTNRQRFAENYEKIFNKTPSEGESQLDEGVHTTEGDGRSGESKLREYAEGQGVLGQADQEQTVEPVAWGEPNGIGDVIDVITDDDRKHDVTQWSKSYTLPLYAHPPKREPLSDDDIAKLWGEKFSGETLMVRNFARAIEKAHGIGA